MTKRIALAAVTLTLAFSFAGCGSDAGSDSNAPALDTTTRKIVVDNDSDQSVYKFDIDGTTCVVYDGYKSGGIDCDFSDERTGPLG